jgi:hypothetical protein
MWRRTWRFCLHLRLLWRTVHLVLLLLLLLLLVMVVILLLL